MSKEMRKYIDTFKQRILKENEEFNENDTTEYVDCLESLKKVNNGIHRQEVILWFNENDIDYFNMTDLDMYIYYIEKNADRTKAFFEQKSFMVDKQTFKDIDKPLYKEPKTGKEHSLNYEDIDSEFSKYLRQNYYNVKLSNEDVSLIRKEWKENF